jgi:1-phosphofructokinase family hexose kinase
MIFTVTLNPAIDRELAVPAIVFDQVLRATAARVDVGGKGFNVSRMLASLGAESVAIGFAGGAPGEQLRRGLEALGIATDFVPIAGETRTNISVVPEARDHSLKVNEAGPMVSAAEQQAMLAKVRGAARHGDWWVLAGSLPPGVPATFYGDLIGAIKAAGASVALDTSGAALQQGCAAGPSYVKPNSVEISQLSGKPVTSRREALEAALALDHIPYVAVSLGAEGALLAQKGQGWLAHPPTIRERSAIGAGDSMVAGMVWGLGQGDALEALRWGVACGAATASRDGTEVGTRDEVLRLAQQVRIERLV